MLVVSVLVLVTMKLRDLEVVEGCLDQVGVQAIGALVVDDVDASLRGRGAARSDWSAEAGG